MSLLVLFSKILQATLGFGLVSVLKREYFKQLNSDNNFKDTFSNIVNFTVLSSIGILAILLLVGDLIFFYLFGNIEYYWYGFITSLSAFVLVISNYYSIMLQVKEKSYKYLTLSILVLSFSLILTYILIVQLDLELIGYVISIFISSLFHLLVSILMQRKIYKIKYNRKETKTLLSIGIPLVPHQLANIIINLSDTVFLSAFVSLTAVGIYSLSYTVGSIVDIVSAAIMVVFSNIFLKLANSRGNEKEISELSTLYFAVIISIGTIIIIYGKEILLLLGNSSYLGGLEILPLIVGGFVIKAFYHIGTQQLLFKGATQVLPKVTIFTAILNLLLNYLLIVVFEFGINGAAYASIISYIISTILISYAAQKAFFVNYEKKKILKISLSSVSVILVLFFLSNIINETVWHITKIVSLLIYMFYVMSLLKVVNLKKNK